jgi:tight adherence protein C
MILIAVVLWMVAIYFAAGQAMRVLVRPSPMASRLSGIAEPRGTVPMLDTVSDRLLKPLGGWVGTRIGSVLPWNVADRIELMLVQAGSPMTQGKFLTILVAAPLFMLLMAILIVARGALAPHFALLAAIGLVAFGIAGPIIWLRGKVSRRQKRISRELPDALDLLVVSVEAGLGLEGAMARVTEAGDGPVPWEFRRVLADMNLGSGRRRAMQAMVMRTGVSSVNSLVGAILQADQTGMGIGDVLRAQSEHLRVQRRQSAEEQAMKAPLKMLFPLVFFIFPSLFVVVLGPAVLAFLNTVGNS